MCKNCILFLLGAGRIAQLLVRLSVFPGEKCTFELAFDCAWSDRIIHILAGMRKNHSSLQDTIVKDPFFEHMPPHFGMTFKELLDAKHPTTWLEFERGDIGEEEALERFWADGRTVDAEALRRMMVRTVILTEASK